MGRHQLPDWYLKKRYGEAISVYLVGGTLVEAAAGQDISVGGRVR